MTNVRLERLGKYKRLALALAVALGLGVLVSLAWASPASTSVYSSDKCHVPESHPRAIPEGTRDYYVPARAWGTSTTGGCQSVAFDLDNNASYETPASLVRSGYDDSLDWYWGDWHAPFDVTNLDGPRGMPVSAEGRTSYSCTSGTCYDVSRDNTYLRIDNVAPEATFSGAPPFSVGAGTPINLSLTEVTDPSSDDTAAGFQYAFDCGDGAGYGAFTSSNSRSCPTSAAGTYTVKGKVKDKDNGASEYTDTVTVLPSLRISDVRVKEKTTNALFTVSLSAQSPETIMVDYATANGKAKAPADYTATSGTLIFNPGEPTTKTIAVPIRGDRRDERNEAFFVNLSGASTTIADGSGRGLIVDND